MSPSADSYRADAERCRRLAASSREHEDAQRWRKLASEYDELARGFDAFHAKVKAFN